MKINVQRRAGRRWSSAGTTSAPVTTQGRYSRVLNKLAAGSYRVQARYLGTGNAAPSSSPYHRFSLHR